MDLLELTANNGADEFYSSMRHDCLEHRVLVFNQEIDENLIEDAILYILQWNRQDKDIPRDKRKRILIYFNSPGGDCFVGNVLVDVILQSETPIIGVGLGLVASACYYAYIACDERVAFKNTVILAHDGSITISNSSKKAKQTMDFFVDEMERRNREYVLSRTNMTDELYEEKYDQEYYFYPSTGKELGVVHKIIGEDCDISYIL